MVKDIIAKKGRFVATVSADDTVLTAAKEMNSRRIGAVVVVDGEKVVGIFTERDVMTRVVAANVDPAKTKVQEVMTCPVACCRLDTIQAECMQVITDKRIRHIPVVEDGNLVGIVTSGDLLAREVFEREEEIGNLSQTIDYLHEYMYGSYR